MNVTLHTSHFVRPSQQRDRSDTLLPMAVTAYAYKGTLNSLVGEYANASAALA